MIGENEEDPGQDLSGSEGYLPTGGDAPKGISDPLADEILEEITVRDDAFIPPFLDFKKVREDFESFDRFVTSDDEDDQDDAEPDEVIRPVH